MKILVVVVAIVVVLLLVAMAAAARIVKQYEEGVLFRLGRVLGTRKPGFQLIIPIVEQLGDGCPSGS